MSVTSSDGSQHGIPDSLTDLAVPVDTLEPYHRNPRRGNIPVIVESLRKNGQYRPVVVNSRTSEVLAGNHTLQAARELGWSHVAATFVDADEEQAARIVAVDNRANDLAGYDNADLIVLLQGLPDLEGTGYDDAALAELLGEGAGEPVALTDPDDVPVPPENPIVKPGDVWLLGPHRVACGDSTSSTVVESLMAGGQADAVWTDPPYGVAYTGGGKGGYRRPIENDALSVTALADFLRESLGLAYAACRPGGAWYVAAPPGPAFLAFGTVLSEFGVWRQTIAWVKDSFVMGRSDYHYRHEVIFEGDQPDPDEDELGPVVYGWKPGAAHQPLPDRKQGTVWEVARPKRSRDHPTQKPVELITRALENSTQHGAVVLDLFGGSGSTMIACHRTHRVARLVELDPLYVDVICRRYQEHTGVLPVLESTGAEHDFTR